MDSYLTALCLFLNQKRLILVLCIHLLHLDYHALNEHLLGLVYFLLCYIAGNVIL